MSGEIEIRRAALPDVPAIERFGSVVVPETYGTLVDDQYAEELRSTWWSFDQLASDVENETLLVATEADGSLVGMCHVGSFDGEPVMWKLYVAPGRRSCGLGKRMVDLAWSQLPHDASGLLTEHIAANERAAAFYEREGFTVVEPRPAPIEPTTTIWRRRTR